MHFANREEAGKRLARLLRRWRGRGVVVEGLARGGVPVAEVVARELDAPLDVAIVRKLATSERPELALGAIGEEGVRLINEAIVAQTRVDESELAEIEEREAAELARRARAYRGGHRPRSVRGRTVIVVDDGIATGASARVACRVARERGASHIVLAAPVAPRGIEVDIGSAADEFAIVEAPRRFRAVGEFYDDFAQTSDDEVVACLERSRGRPPTT